MEEVKGEYFNSFIKTHLPPQDFYLLFWRLAFCSLRFLRSHNLKRRRWYFPLDTAEETKQRY